MDRLMLREKIAKILVDYGKYYASPRSIPDSANKYADQILALIPDCEACVGMSAGKPVKAEKDTYASVLAEDYGSGGDE